MRLRKCLRLKPIPQDCCFNLLLYRKPMKGLSTLRGCEGAEKQRPLPCLHGLRFRAGKFVSQPTGLSLRRAYCGVHTVSAKQVRKRAHCAQVEIVRKEMSLPIDTENWRHWRAGVERKEWCRPQEWHSKEVKGQGEWCVGRDKNQGNRMNGEYGLG